MARCFVVQIDLVLRRRVKWNDGSTLTVSEARQWLRANGFAEAGANAWRADEATIDLLRQREILAKREER